MVTERIKASEIGQVWVNENEKYMNNGYSMKNMLIPSRTLVPGEYGAGISSAVLNCLNEKQKVVNSIYKNLQNEECGNKVLENTLILND